MHIFLLLSSLHSFIIKYNLYQPSRWWPSGKSLGPRGLLPEPCGCSYDGHRRLIWSLTSGPVGLVEVRANWPGHPR